MMTVFTCYHARHLLCMLPVSPCLTVCAGTAANFFKTSVEAQGQYVEKVRTLQH